MSWAIVRLPFAATIFIGAFLMFQIQPLVGKIVTAHFGGSAAIWGVCLLFFQFVVLAGYALTYALNQLKPRWQCVIYAVLMVVSALCLNVPEPAAWESGSTGDVALALLYVLSVHLAFPCLMLASVSGMLQTWFNLSRLGNPYPLYSLSNIGSLGALVTYPVLIEPYLSLSGTINIWRLLFFLLVLFVCPAAIYVFKKNPAVEEKSNDARESAAPAAAAVVWWAVLGFMGTVGLISYTCYLTQDIAPVPLIYVIPLCLYLASFIICFADERFYNRAIFVYLTPLLWVVESMISAVWVDRTHETVAMLWSVAAVLAFISSFFISCQGELYASRPAPRHLAVFYLAIATGGALGGVFVNFAAPALFNTYLERYIVGVFAVVISVRIAIRHYHHATVGQIANYILAAVCGSALTFLIVMGKSSSPNLVDQQRNFFGCLSIYSMPGDVSLRNGRIMHGCQFKDPDRRRIPTTYYNKGTALGFFDYNLRRKHEGEPLKYGVVGLGAGTIAAYGQDGDSITFYEIDPKVISAARTHFTFLSDSPAKVRVLQGDARNLLNGQKPQGYNLLVVDAFNGDAVPVHLLTKECMLTYMRHLAPDGIIALHVTNRFLDLEPVLANLAQSLNLRAFTLRSPESKYVVLSRLPDFAPSVPDDPEAKSRFENLTIRPSVGSTSVGLWTDDYSNLFATMAAKWKH